MPQRKVPVRELINFIVKVRHHASQEGDEKKQLQMVRNLSNRMYNNYIGYDWKGEYRLKARGETPYQLSVEERRAYEERWAGLVAAVGPVAIRFLGHSAVEVSGTRTVLVDPYIDDNPALRGDLTTQGIDRAHAVCVTLDHPHHVGSALEICRRTGATLVAATPLAERLAGDGVRALALNVGGEVTIDGLWVRMVDARHVSARPPAVGYVLGLDGYTIYHAGDTGLFETMRWLGQEFDIDMALVPIGGRYTMGPREAAQATAWLRPRYVVPIHYGTFRQIDADVEEFLHLASTSAEVVLLRPGQSFRMERGSATPEPAPVPIPSRAAAAGPPAAIAPFGAEAVSVEADGEASCYTLDAVAEVDLSSAIRRAACVEADGGPEGTSPTDESDDSKPARGAGGRRE